MLNLEEADGVGWALRVAPILGLGKSSCAWDGDLQGLNCSLLPKKRHSQAFLLGCLNVGPNRKGWVSLKKMSEIKSQKMKSYSLLLDVSQVLIVTLEHRGRLPGDGTLTS